MVTRSDEFENSCIPMHWQIKAWPGDLCIPFGQSRITHCGAHVVIQPFMGSLKPHSNVPLPIYSNMMIGTLAVDGWAVTFGTAKRGLGGAPACPVPSSLYQMM